MMTNKMSGKGTLKEVFKSNENASSDESALSFSSRSFSARFTDYSK